MDIFIIFFLPSLNVFPPQILSLKISLLIVKIIFLVNLEPIAIILALLCCLRQSSRLNIIATAASN